MTLNKVLASKTLVDAHSLVTHHAAIFDHQESLSKRLDIKFGIDRLHLRIRSHRDI